MTGIAEATSRLIDPASRKQAPAKRLSGVDGLRGLAAIIVVIFHMYGAAGGPEWRVIHHVNILRPLMDGWAAVNLFLVLSGFCLYWPFAQRPGKLLRPLQIRDYAVRRSMRILPTYYASLLFVVLIGWLTPLRNQEPHCFPVAWWDLLDHVLLLNAWVPASMTSWNSVTWSLSVEWTWYAVFPIALILYRRFGPVRGLLILTAVMLLYRIGLFLCLGTIGHYSTNVGFAWRTFVLGRLFEFGAGMAVAAFISSGQSIPHLARIGVPIILFAALIAGRMSEAVDGFLPVRDICYGTASVSLLLLVVLPGSGWMKWIFEHAVFVWLGEFSYTLYLFHLVFVTAFAMWLKSRGFEGLRLFFVSLTFLPVTLLACFGIYFVVERPLLVRRPKPSVSPSIATV